MSKLEEIIDYLEGTLIDYEEIIDEESIDIVHDLYLNNNKRELTTEDGIVYLYYGEYYNYIEKDVEQMKKYYLLAIDSGNGKAMYRMAVYYQKEENYDEMIKYYLMAIDKNNCMAMNKLAEYYHSLNNYDEMRKYYFMAIERSDVLAMINIAHFYQKNKKYRQMKKYYLMAIDLDSDVAMTNLAHYYKTIARDNDLAIKYYLMAVENENSYAMFNLGKLYQEIGEGCEAKAYYKMAAKRGLDVAMAQLSQYYIQVENKQEKGMKYCIMAANAGSKDCIDALNVYLRIKFSADVALQMAFTLEKDNLKTLVGVLLERLKDIS